MQFENEPKSGNANRKTPLITRILDRTVSRKTRMQQANMTSQLDFALESEDLSIREYELRLRMQREGLESIHKGPIPEDMVEAFSGILAGETELYLKDPANHQPIERPREEGDMADVKVGFLGQLVIKAVKAYAQRRQELAELDRETEQIKVNGIRILSEDVFYLGMEGRYAEIAEDWISVLSEQLIADIERHLD